MRCVDDSMASDMPVHCASLLDMATLRKIYVSLDLNVLHLIRLENNFQCCLAGMLDCLQSSACTYYCCLNIRVQDLSRIHWADGHAQMPSVSWRCLNACTIVVHLIHNSHSMHNYNAHKTTATHVPDGMVRAFC